MGVKLLRLGVAVTFFSWLVVAGSASAAFPGRNGMLAVQPLRGAGLILVSANGSHQRTICATGSPCGSPGRPQFSPDGREILFAGPAVRLVATDGSCVDCDFGVASSPAFLPAGTDVTFIFRGGLLQDSIDGLRQANPSGGLRGISGAVWSESGELAEVVAGRVWIGRPGHLRVVGVGNEPDWAPDGARLVIVRHGWVTVVRVSGGTARRLARGTAPVFSPDGRFVAFIGPRHQVEVIAAEGGRSRLVGTIRGKSLDWQPLPAHPKACVAPEGSTVVARSPQAVVTVNTGVVTGDSEDLPGTAVMGCLYADGVERLLDHSVSNSIDWATQFGPAAVSGAYAAVVADNEDEHYGGGKESVEVFDLVTGKAAGFGGETVCSNDPICGSISRVVVGAGGVSAVDADGVSASDTLHVLCASASLCLATDSFGQFVASTSPALGSWTASTGAPAYVSGAGWGSCPSAQLCVIADGPLYTSTDPAAGTWSTFSAPGVPPPSFSSVSCPATTLCVAGTSAGQIAVSTDPAAGASSWSFEDVDPANTILGISCPSTSDCVATDPDGHVLTTADPTAGPSAWTATTVNNNLYPSDVTCPTASLCVALEWDVGVAVSTAPSSGQWKSVPLAGVQAISCPSSSLCVAAAGNAIAYSTDPASGDWTSNRMSGLAGSLSSIACPTTTFCVATGELNGEVLVSTDPSGGASTWTPVDADQISCAATPRACDTEQIIASDQTGVHVVDSTSEYEPQSPLLSNLALDGSTLTWEHAGAPMSTQLTP